jgi:hypothetical protein
LTGSLGQTSSHQPVKEAHESILSFIWISAGAEDTAPSTLRPGMSGAATVHAPDSAPLDMIGWLVLMGGRWRRISEAAFQKEIARTDVRYWRRKADIRPWATPQAKKIELYFNDIRVRCFIQNGAPNTRYSTTLYDAAPVDRAGCIGAAQDRPASRLDGRRTMDWANS